MSRRQVASIGIDRQHPERSTRCYDDVAETSVLAGVVICGYGEVVERDLAKAFRREGLR